MRHLARHGRSPAPVATPVPSHPGANGPFIGRFATQDFRSSPLTWNPSKEADVDTDNTREPTPAHRPQPAAVTAIPHFSARATRWRQRPAAPDSAAHVDLPPAPPGDAVTGRTMADGPATAADPTGASPTTTATTATAASPGDAPALALRDDELRLLARRAQGATLRLDFELRTSLVRQVFRRDFVYVSRQLHGLEASRRVQGLDRAGLNDALLALERRARDVTALFDRIAADLQAAIDTRAPAPARIAFARPARFQATIIGPGAHRYLALLQHADHTLARLELAWLLGLVDPANRTALTSDCRRALHGFKDLACHCREAVGDQVREINAQRRKGMPGADEA
jgi:hypothetical protein